MIILFIVLVCGCTQERVHYSGQLVYRQEDVPVIGHPELLTTKRAVLADGDVIIIKKGEKAWKVRWMDEELWMKPSY